MSRVCLTNRSVVRIAGEEAAHFLQNLVTCDIEAVHLGKAGFGALLAPQGKILFDFFIHRTDDNAFLMETDASRVDAFIARLGLYRLRAKIEIKALPEHGVMAGWDEPPPALATAASTDPRLEALGWRAIMAERAAQVEDEAAYHTRRIALAVPQGGMDFAFGDAFPHEVDMDQLNGVSFNKGCYVGQEVVSRMQHRTIARTRCIGASFTASAPPPGSAIMAADKTIGTTGSAASGRLVAMVRIDKVSEAIAAGETITAAGIPLVLHKPDWAAFDFSAMGMGQ